MLQVWWSEAVHSAGAAEGAARGALSPHHGGSASN